MNASSSSAGARKSSSEPAAVAASRSRSSACGMLSSREWTSASSRSARERRRRSADSSRSSVRSSRDRAMAPAPNQSAAAASRRRSAASRLRAGVSSIARSSSCAAVSGAPRSRASSAAVSSSAASARRGRWRRGRDAAPARRDRARPRRAVDERGAVPTPTRPRRRPPRRAGGRTAAVRARAGSGQPSPLQRPSWRRGARPSAERRGCEHELQPRVLVECAHVSANELANVGRQGPVGVSVSKARVGQALRDLECVERVAGAHAVQPDHSRAGEMHAEPFLKQVMERGNRQRRQAKPLLGREPVGDRRKHDSVDDARRREHGDPGACRSSPEELERTCGRQVEPLQVVDSNDDGRSRASEVTTLRNAVNTARGSGGRRRRRGAGARPRAPRAAARANRRVHPRERPRADRRDRSRAERRQPRRDESRARGSRGPLLRRYRRARPSSCRFPPLPRSGVSPAPKAMTRAGLRGGPARCPVLECSSCISLELLRMRVKRSRSRRYAQSLGRGMRDNVTNSRPRVEGHVEPGLREALVTASLQDVLAALPPALLTRTSPLAEAEAPDRVSRHVAALLESAIKSAPDGTQAAEAVRLARQLLTLLGDLVPGFAVSPEIPTEPGQVLEAVLRRQPDGSALEIERPLTPLLDTTVFTNAPGEPSVGHELRAEIASAESIDVVMAFIRWSGVRPLFDALSRHVREGKHIRVLTTTYTNSTEQRALDELSANWRRCPCVVRHDHDEAACQGVDLSSQWRVLDCVRRFVQSDPLCAGHRAGMERSPVGRAEPRCTREGSRSLRLVLGRPRFRRLRRRRVSRAHRTRRDGGSHSAQPRRHRAAALSRTTARAHRRGAAAGPLSEFARRSDRNRQDRDVSRRLCAVAPFPHTRPTPFRGSPLRNSRTEPCDVPTRPERSGVWRALGWAPSTAAIRTRLRFNPEPFRLRRRGDRPTALRCCNRRRVPPRCGPDVQALLEHLQPTQLLGLTATPERSDGLDVFAYFDGRIAAELRVWDAIDQQYLAPFAYYGVHDGLDLQEVPWRRGVGYDVDALTNVFTADHAWVRRILEQIRAKVAEPARCARWASA